MNVNKTYTRKFLIPALLIYTILFIAPAVIGFGYSFTNWNMMSDKVKFIGLDNFKYIFFQDPSLVKIIMRTLLFALITTLLKNVLGLVFALLLNENLKTKNALRTIYFLPVTLSPLIIGLIFISILQPSGILNNFLNFVGLGSLAQSWLAVPKYALTSLIGVEVWRNTGLNIAIFMAGLQMIPKSYYEAASIDGANSWRKLLYITLPYVLPAITINVILNIIQGLKVFDLVFSLTSGGPGNSTQVLNTAVFTEFSAGNYGLATALGVVMFVLICLISFSTLKLLTRKEFAER